MKSNNAAFTRVCDSKLLDTGAGYSSTLNPERLSEYIANGDMRGQEQDLLQVDLVMSSSVALLTSCSSIATMRSKGMIRRRRSWEACTCEGRMACLKTFMVMRHYGAPQ